MIKVSVAKKEEWPQLCRLWQTAFGDEAATIDHFFTKYGGDRLLVLREGNEPKAMLVLLPLEGVTAAGERFLLPYVYALTTDPESRGKGHAKTLLNYAAWRAREMGAAGICTVPAEPSLHRFFASAGYEECFVTRRWSGTPGVSADGEVTKIGGTEYAKLRESLLTGRAYGAWSGSLVGIQEDFSASSGGGLYRLELDGGVGCAAVERWADKNVAKELLCPPELTERAAALLAERLGGETWEFRAPVSDGTPGEDWAFGMTRWFDAGKKAEFESTYLGLAFD